MTRSQGRKHRKVSQKSPSRNKGSKSDSSARNSNSNSDENETRGILPIRMVNSELKDERKLSIIALLMQDDHTTLMSAMLKKHSTDESNYLRQAAKVAAQVALDDKRRVPTQALRQHVECLYGNHIKITPDGKASYSYQFYDAFKHLENSEREEIMLASQTSNEGDDDDDEKTAESDTLLSGGKEEGSDEEDTIGGKEEGSDEENPIMETIDEEDSDDDEILEKLPGRFSSVVTKLGRPFNSFREALSPNSTPPKTTPSPTPKTPTKPSAPSPTDLAVKTAIQEIDDEALLEMEIETDPFRKAIMATPSPRKSRVKKDEKREQSESEDETVEEPEAQIQRPPPRDDDSTQTGFLEQLDSLARRVSAQEATQDTRHAILKSRCDDQFRLITKMEKTLQEKENKIQTLKREIGDLQRNRSLTNLQQAIKKLKKQGEELVADTTLQLNELETQGESYLTRFQTKCKEQLDEIDAKTATLKDTIQQGGNMDSQIKTELKAVIAAQSRAFEDKLVESAKGMITQGREKMSRALEQRMKSLEASAQSLHDFWDKKTEECNTALISNMDAISAEYDEARKQTVAKFNTDFVEEIQQLYSKERVIYAKAVETLAEKIFQKEENRIAAFATTKAKEITQDGSFNQTIQASLEQQMKNAKEQIKSIKDEIKEEHAAQKANLESYHSDLRKDLATMKSTTKAEFQTLVTNSTKDFETMVELEKNISENRKAEARYKEGEKPKTEKSEEQTEELEETQAHQSPPAKQTPPATKRTTTGTSTLANTPFDHRSSSSGGGGDDDPDDPSDDESVGNFSDSASSRTRRRSRLPKSRNYKSRAHKYKLNLTYFTEKHKFLEHQHLTMTSKTADSLYRALYRTMTGLYLPLLPIEDLRPNGTCISSEDEDIIAEFSPTALDETADILYEKLNLILDPEDKPAREILDVYYGNRDGYKALYALMHRYLRKLQLNTKMWSATPWTSKQTAFEFAGEIVSNQKEARDLGQHRYTDMEMKREFILQSRKLPQFQSLTTTILFLMDLMGEDFIKNYGFDKLMRFYDMVDKMNKGPDDGVSTITESTIHQLQDSTMTINKFNKSRRPRKEIQCDMCCQYGHSIDTDHICYFAGKLYYCLKQLGLLKASCIDQAALIKHGENATKYRDYNLPANIKLFHTTFGPEYQDCPIDDINMFGFSIGRSEISDRNPQRVLHDSEESTTRPSTDVTLFATKVEQIQSEEVKEQQKDQRQRTKKEEQDKDAMNRPTLKEWYGARDINWTARGYLVVQHLIAQPTHPNYKFRKKRNEEEKRVPPPNAPFRFEPGILEAFAPEQMNDDMEPTYCTPPAIRKARKVEFMNDFHASQRHVQGDTGANVSATNDITLLWNYRRLYKRIDITTFDGHNDTTTRCQAIGTGTIRIISNDNSMVEFKAYYIPNSTGTIISPDHFVRSNPDIKSFTHFGHEDANIGGYISFGDENGETVTKINMARKDGLWFTTNKLLLNPKAKPPLTTEDIHPTLRKINMELCDEMEHQDDFVNWRTDMRAVINQVAAPTVTAAKAYKDLELWHQRMGHISPRSMIETSRVVDGMPSFPSNNTHFSCPFCDKAKIQKPKANKKSTRECYEPGTTFHMDLGFIHDSKIVGKGKHAKRQTLLKDRKGHTAYLLIIDSASKYVWVFPLTSKQPPLDIINKFLDRHGRAHKRKVTGITTTPNGALATSQQFTELLEKRQLEKHEQEMDLEIEQTPLESM